MPQHNSRSQELVIPAASLAALRRSLTEQLGAQEAALALQRAGHAAGDAFYLLLLQTVDGGGSDGLAQLGEDAFWRRFNELLAARGWGQLRHEQAHVGVGALNSTSWGEADPVEFGTRPSCFFSTGLFSSLLGKVAGREVGVFEVECRSKGDDRCRFLFGGADALGAVYQALADGRDVDDALTALQ
ncbi:MAG: V4R domain-containing protein [Longimicrobiales bacterium]